MCTGQVATWAISMVYTLVVSRYLGPARQGELSLAMAVVGVAALVIDLGMDTLIMRTVARAPERAGAMAGMAIAMRAAISAPMAAALYLYVDLAHLSAETRTAVYLYAAAMIIGTFRGVMWAMFQGMERMSVGAIGATVSNLLDLLAALVIIRLHDGVVAFAAASIVNTLVSLALNAGWMRGAARLSFRLSMAGVREMVVGSLAFWANTVFLSIYISIDSIILGTIAGTTAVGIYAPATKLFAVALFLPAIIGQVTLPLLSRLGAEAGADYVRVGRKTLSLLVVSAIPMTVGLATFAGPLIHLLYGLKYQQSAPVLTVLSLCVPFTFLNVELSQMLAARDRQWIWTRVMAASAVINPLLNLYLIPLAAHQWHNASVGAALALLATELLMTVYGIVVMRDVAVHAGMLRDVLGSSVAGLAQYAVIWATATLWAPIGQALGLLVYAAVAIAMGTLPREDLALMRDTLTGRARRFGERARPRVDVA
jgi:O-antigen/teichoic acid export membrane protein